MSYIVSTACVRLKTPGVAKNVLMQLADIANDEGFAWPSLETLCMRTCWGRTAVIEAIAWLELNKAIKPDRTNGRKTVYWLTPDAYTGERFDDLSTGRNRTASRTGLPVRQPDRTSPPNGPNQSAKRTLTTKNHQEPNTPQPPTGGAHGFENFYAEYPRQVDEVRARMAWDALAPDAALQAEIARAVALWSRTDAWRREDGRFVPKPAKWLSGKRWRDVPGLAIATAAPAAPPLPRETAETPEQLAARKQKAKAAADYGRALLLGGKSTV